MWHLCSFPFRSRRGEATKGYSPFRESFSKLGELRSIVKEGELRSVCIPWFFQTITYLFKITFRIETAFCVRRINFRLFCWCSGKFEHSFVLIQSPEMIKMLHMAITVTVFIDAIFRNPRIGADCFSRHQISWTNLQDPAYGQGCSRHCKPQQD